MRRARLWFRCLTLSLAASAAACSVPSRSDLEVMQSVNDLGEAVNAMRQDYGVLTDQVDSLRLIVARQDTVLRQLANLAGVAVPSPR
ncbi:MAG TPA: hypothetical protein VGQ52_03215 [Gemmatimonadaceae bacterium]|nr:hypothetical protein [Gemmatimonadaceae bacterium]